MKYLLSPLAALLLFAVPVQAEHHQEKDKVAPESSHSKVISPGGIIAHYFRFTTPDGDPEGRVFVEKEGRIVATLVGVRSVSFSPAGEILLVREDVADDDLRHYFLDIGAGQYERTDPRMDYVFGSRFVTRVEWSENGRFVVLFDHPGITDAPPEVIKVADKLGKAPKAE